MIAIIFLILIFLFFLTVLRTLYVQQLERDVQLEQSYVMTLDNIYLHMKERVESIRIYRHDLADHIQMLEALMKKENSESQMASYLEEVQLQYAQIKQQRYCSNEVVNILLETRLEACKEKGIPFSIQVMDGVYKRIEEKDLVKLIHNLLDNAIEANEKIPLEEKRGITFILKEKNGIVLQVKNQYEQHEKLDFKTRKADFKNHGYGMKIIGDTVKKYDGNWEVQVQKQEHVVEQVITIPRLQYSI